MCWPRGAAAGARSSTAAPRRHAPRSPVSAFECPRVDPRDRSPDADRRTDHHTAARCRERLHDVCVVRTPAQSLCEPVVPRGTRELGDRVLRVPAAGAGQPHRLHGDDAAAAQDPAGSDHAARVRSVRMALHAAAAQARLSLGSVLHPRCRLFRVQEMTMATARTAIHERVEACRAGQDPTIVARLQSGWVVMGDPQVLQGYVLVLPDPVVPHLNAMPPAGQVAFLADVAAVGQAVLEVTQAVRINYAIFGNLEPALHAHVFPRHANESPALRTVHPWGYDWTQARRFDAAID